MKKNTRNLLFLTAFATGTIHLVNRFIDITAEMKNILKTEDGNYFDWKNGKIYYTKRGNGSPVLLVHDLDPISSSYEWCRFSKKLEKTHTVYTLDLLGCGRSDKPFLTYTNYIYVQLITDFIKEIVKDTPDVITTNNSISFAVLAANMDKTLIRKILSINPPPIKGFEQTTSSYAVWKKLLLKLPIFGTFLYNLKTHEKNIQKILRETYFYKPQLVSAKMLDAYYEAAHMKQSHGKYLLASIEGNYIDNSISHVLKEIEIPLYIIESSNLKNAMSIADSYAKKSKMVETTYISNAGMIPQLETPDKLLEIVHMILDRDESTNFSS